VSEHMRRFLYYNQDSINSFLAQIEKGLLQMQQAGSSYTDSNTTNSELHSSVTGDLSAKLFGLGTSLKGDIKAIESENVVISEMNKSIHEIILHDFAFDKVYDYLSNNKMICSDNLKICDVVLSEEVPTFLDFGYIQGLFASNGVYKLASEQSRKEMESQLNELRQNIPKGKGVQIPQAVSAQIKLLENTVKNAGKDSENERKELERTFDAIRSVLPYKRFLMTDCLLIPLVDDYFRDDPNIVSFKYGGKISMLGYVTNVITEDVKLNHSNDISPLYDMLNAVMLKLFKDKGEVFIIHPIALFY